MPNMLMRDVGDGPEPIRSASKVWRLDFRRGNEVTETVCCGRCPQQRRLGEVYGSRTDIKAATGPGLVGLTGDVWQWRCPGQRCRAEHPTTKAELLTAYIAAIDTAERVIVLPLQVA